ncbi:MAG: TetR/AcrR family transcriptional regulator [Actinobacteria bacterium]|nr:TetR/AcrR family transcriptional regulator [Actinomycetota bacterium]
MTRREEIVAAARRCFATKGYEATTIRDVEEAAGLSPGAGGLYRHVPSKEALLDAVVAAEVDANRAAIVDMAIPEGLDARGLLEHGVRQGLAQLDRQADVMRIVFRDLPAFPHLVETVRTGLIDAVYESFATGVRAGRDAGTVPAHVDPEAVALVAIGPIVDLKLKQHLLGITPLDVDEDRLVETWVDVFATYLGARP